MKTYPHILDHHKPHRTNLRFVKEIDPEYGTHHEPTAFPQDWENVRHVVGSLYYAWDKEPLLGCLYLCSWDNK